MEEAFCSMRDSSKYGLYRVDRGFYPAYTVRFPLYIAVEGPARLRANRGRNNNMEEALVTRSAGKWDGSCKLTVIASVTASVEVSDVPLRYDTETGKIQ
jgi:hypothetical protein